MMNAQGILTPASAHLVPGLRTFAAVLSAQATRITTEIRPFGDVAGGARKGRQSMNWTHLHLLSNHLPVVGTVFGVGLLAWGVLRRNDAVQRAALGTFVLVALLALPAYFTGEPAERVMEHAAGVGEASIDAHEAAALMALIGVEVVGFLALIALYRAGGGRSLSALATRAVLVMGIVTAGLVAWTADLGGRIRHPEIRSGAEQTMPVDSDDGNGR
jgi:uncharacterized membrane protein